MSSTSQPTTGFDERRRIEGEVAQVIEPEEKDQYMIPSDVAEASEGKALVVVWTSEVAEWRRATESSRILGLLEAFATPVLWAGVRFGLVSDVDAETVAVEAPLFSEGDEVELEATPAVVDGGVVGEGLDVSLWNATVERIRRGSR